MTHSSFYTHHVTSEAQRSTSDPDVAGTFDMHVYHPKRTTCLRCGEVFDSYDPRYNRRCAGCTKSLQGQDDRYNY